MRFLILVLTLVSAFVATPVFSEPYPLDYWARRAAISNVSLSPDGQRLGLLKIPAKGENPVIEVYETGALEKEPFRINASPMEITSFNWVDDSNIVFTARQQVRDQIEGFNQGIYEYRLALADIKSRKLKSFDERDPSVVSVLPDKKGKILISFSEG